MAVRHEEKYIIPYSQYLLLLQRAQALLTPDAHGIGGSYTITSLYYDDPLDTALTQKQEGLPEHCKFRVRTYDFDDSIIKLERKEKNGVLTKKVTASLTRPQIGLLQGVNTPLDRFEGPAYDLAAQMASGAQMPAIAVRYRRDAFFLAGTDFRLTFDTQLQTLSAEECHLFSDTPGLPALDWNSAILEIKYGTHLPAFVRLFTAGTGKQLSVSKYALCREQYLF